mmetsp:Transcript_20519/g.28868  ORF Transcript_20519/g.28868 Transcript_20519/m.28868 type:complete len:267 (-) Transcript_20519:101-901(-)|eukprot:CAMPEP_0175095608 /NCGR_PEP_ID=MMETSP0086_2-20121207/4255_1 /TAXON_ID=136419 /ORGANISM="Unknown Unknown, Strain D1" /LENGTH=266 /DNA_ID=CAMNT_0016368885 /DNA_START=27 /DNA_END=827 /DNA_ORIENTATION=-
MSSKSLSLLAIAFAGVGVLLQCIGTGLPQWIVVRRAIHVAEGQDFDNSKCKEFDCSAGIGIWSYNFLSGNCCKCEDGTKCDADTKTYWDSFSLTSLACKKEDPENAEFVPVPGKASGDNPKPADKVPLDRMLTYKAGCAFVQTGQGLSIVGILISLVGVGVAISAMQNEKKALVSGFTCLVGSAFAFGTYFWFSGGPGLQYPLFPDDATESIATLMDTSVGRVSTTIHGPAANCEAAGAALVGLAGLIQLIRSAAGEERKGGTFLN